MLTSRNTIVALPAIFALVAIGFEQIADKVSQAMALLAFSTLSLLLIFHQPPYYNTVTKPQIREAAQALIASHPDPEKVYAAEEVVRNFNVYFSLYNAPFRAQPVSRLYQDYREKNLLPVKFWLIEGRVLGPLFDQVMPDPKAHMLQKTEFIGAGFMSMELTP